MSERRRDVLPMGITKIPTTKRQDIFWGSLIGKTECICGKPKSKGKYFCSQKCNRSEMRKRWHI